MPMPDGALPILRSTPQHSDVYLVIQQPEWRTPGLYPIWDGYLWSCQIDGISVGDPIVSIAVNNGAAGPINLLDGMTVFIGSELGGWDYALLRLRGDQTVGAATVTLDIATSSDLREIVPDDAWVVVLDEFRLWQRFGYIDTTGDTTIFRKDWDIDWTSLGANDAARRLAMLPPIPIMGPHAVEFVDVGGNVNIDFDWSDSYAPAPLQNVTTWVSVGETDHIGGTWNDNVDNPAPQTYSNISGLAGFRVTLTVDDGNGCADNLPQRRGNRYVFTLRRPGQTQAGDPPNSEPIIDFSVSDIMGSSSQGYWKTSITVYGSQASEYEIIPGALVVLFAEDWYYGTAGYLAGHGANLESIGPISNRENILFVGRISDGTIVVNSETGDVTFDVISTGEMARMAQNFPIPIQDDTNLEFSDWLHVPGLTTDRAVIFYLSWHSTLPVIADAYLIEETVPVKAYDFPDVDIFSAVSEVVNARKCASFLCDRFGRFKVEINLQVRDVADGNTLWVVEAEDMLEPITVQQVMHARTHVVEAGGILYNPAANTFTPFLSQAPGLFYKYRGTSGIQYNNLAVNTQDNVNVICGRLLAMANNEFPRLGVGWTGNWRVLDIWPQEYVAMNLVTDRVIFINDLFIPREISMKYDPVAGVIFVSSVLEKRSDGPPGVTIPIDGSIPTPVAIDPPRIDIEPSYPPAPPVVGYAGAIVSTINEWGHAYNPDDDLPDASPTWAALDNDQLTVSGSKRIYDTNVVTWANGQQSIFAATYCGIYEYFPLTDDIDGTWTARATTGDMANSAGIAAGTFRIYHMCWSIEYPGRSWAIWTSSGSGMMANYYCGVSTTYDGWKTVQHSYILDHHVSNYTVMWQECEVSVDQSSNGRIVFAVFSHPSNPHPVPSCHYCYRSTDAGQNFSQVHDAGNHSWCSVHVAPSDSNYVYYTMGNNIFRSINGGTNWTQIGGSISYSRRLAVCPTDRDLVTLMSRHKLYTWDGSSWTEFLEDWHWNTGLGVKGGYAYRFMVLDRDSNKHPSHILWVGRDSNYDGKILISDGATRSVKTGNWNALTGDVYCWCIAMPEIREGA